MRISPIKQQQGIATLMGAAFMMVVVLAVLVNLLQMTGSDIMDVAEHEDGAEAFFLAESAIEYAVGSWDSGTDCVDLDNGGAISFGEGTFSIDSAVLQSDEHCRVNVTGTVNSAVRKLQADLQLGCGEGWAVGVDTKVGYWDGATWSAKTTSGSNYQDVYCLRKTDAWAVNKNGDFYNWNGTTWSIAFTAEGNKDVYSVHCVKRDDCWAAGESGRFYRLTGGSWSQSQADPGGLKIFSVHCVTGSDCWAVGETGKFYRLTGVTWAAHSTSAQGKYLYAVHCVSTSDCWAGGESGLIYRWNSTSWSLHTALSEGKNINSIYCVSSSDCWAVADENSGTAVIAYWNGSNWNTSTPGPGTAPGYSLYGIRCAATNDCWAVGNVTSTQENFVRWQGSSWAAMPANSALPNAIFNAVHATPSTAVIEWSEVVQ